MKRKYLIIGSMSFLHFFAKAQKVDSSVFKVSKTEINVVYNHYMQDGNHSAVTGGIGTEELVVYGPSFSVKKLDGRNTFGVSGGADIISSASTDRIDFVMSSASSLDARSHANLFYGKKFMENRLSLNAGTGFSLESDYFSIPVNVGAEYTDPVQMSTYSAEFQLYFDDLRWGRINPGIYKPVKLIYPEELRFKEWYTEYRRNSFNLKLGLSKVLNRRNRVGIFSEVTYQKGLLATPFHRIYFNDGSIGVEQLPDQRWKGGLTLRMNSFIGGATIVKNAVHGYIDNFGVAALSFENEVAIKWTPFIIVKPNFRVHIQEASKYFSPHLQHPSSAIYYTSDYDLSAIQTYRVGVNSAFLMKERIVNSMHLNNIELGYSFYKRSDGLKAHILNVSFLFVTERPKEK